jgi:hypothetical protein
MDQTGIRTINYVVSFLGKHNRTRCLAWLVLYDNYLGHKGGLTLRELTRLTGISYGSLSVSIVKWVRWRYIGYEPRKGGRRYYILKRGRDWIERWKGTMPLNMYLEEIKAH